MPPAGISATTNIAPTSSVELATSTSSWFAATNWAQRCDWLHDTGNVVTEHNIQRADEWFARDATNPAPFKRAKFRLGLQAEMDYFSETNQLSLRPLVDTESEVHMPNAEQRLRLTISTLDPRVLPGQDPNEGASGFRVGLSKGFLKDFDSSTGIRASLPPSVYAHVSWDPRYLFHNLEVYPEQKVGWDSSDGAYETTSLILNQWFGRWVIRPIVSLELSSERYNSDMDKVDQDRENAQKAGVPPPDDNYLKGWDWQLTVMGGYVNMLIDETVYGRLADCSDIADGGGLRFSVLGGLHIIESYNITFLFRNNLYHQWLYYLIKPNISWQSANNWEPDYSLTFGLDMLLYGTKQR